MAKPADASRDPYPRRLSERVRSLLLRPTTLAAPLILWWAYFVRKAYLPHGTGKVWPKIAPLFELPWPPVLKPWWLDFFGALVLAFAALCVGGWVLERLRLECSRAERLLVSTSTGFMGLLLATAALSLVRLYKMTPLRVLVAIFLLLAIVRVRWAVRLLAEVAGSGWRTAKQEPAAILYLTLAGLFVFLGFVLASVPEASFDALHVHLYYPRLFLEQGYFYRADLYRSTAPLYAQVLYSIGLALHGERLAKFLNFLFLPGIALTVFVLVRSILKDRPKATSAGTLGALMCVSSPILLHHSGICYPDLAEAFFGLLALYAAIRFLQDENKSWLCFTGLAAGFAIGTKYAGLYITAILAALMGVSVAWQRGLKSSIRVVAGFGLIAALVGGPWYLRTWYYTGDPIHPVLHNRLQKPVMPAADLDFLMADAMNTNRFPLSASNLLRLPWLLTMDGERLQGTIGPVFLWSLPLVLLGWSWTRSWLAAAWAAIAFCFFWFIGPQWLRYFLPGVAMLSTLAACALYGGRYPPPLRTLWAVLTVAFVLVNLPGLNPTWVSGGQYVPAGAPYAYAFGPVSDEEYMRHSVAGYEAAQYLNALALPPESRLLPVGDNIPPFLSRYPIIDIFENFHIVCYNEKGEFVGCFELSSDTLRANMDRHRVGLVSIRRGWAWIKSVLALRLEDPLLRSDFQFLSYQGGCFLYRRAPGGPMAGRRYVNADLLYRFATNSDVRASDPFDIRLSDQEPPRAEVRLSLLLVPPNEVSFLLHFGEKPQLAFALGLDPQAAASAHGTEFSVYVRPRHGQTRQVFSYRFLPEMAAKGWLPFTVDLSDYSGQESFLTLRTTPVIVGSHDRLAVADPVVYAQETGEAIFETTAPFVFEPGSEKRPLAVRFTPDAVRSGRDEYTIEIPALANQSVDLLSSVRGGMPEAAEKFCRLDAHGRAKIFVPAGIPPGVIRIVGVRPSGRDRWLAAQGSIEVVH